MSYQTQSALHRNSWITAATVPDPDNLPIPLGWTVLIRPYSVKDKTSGGIIMANNEIDFMNYVTNIGRIVAIGPCCWSQPHHKSTEGKTFQWAKVGDFVSFPKNVGARRKFKGVSYVMVIDDEITEILRDPLVSDTPGSVMDIPQEHLEKYNTVYNKDFKNV